MSDLAIALGVRRKNKYAKGGKVAGSKNELDLGFEGGGGGGRGSSGAGGETMVRLPGGGQEGISQRLDRFEKEGRLYDGEGAPKFGPGNLPREEDYMAKGGLISSDKIISGLKAKKMAQGGMVNQGDNMPVNDDIDMLSAETSTEGPLGEGMHEDEREDKIMKRKGMLDKIMYRMHSDNKGA